jgi:acyl carrier protein
MFNLDWTDQSTLQVGSASGAFQRNPYCYSRFQFSLSIGQRHDGLELYCEYNAELLKPETTRRWLAHYEGILRQFTANSDCKLRDLPPLLLPDGKVELAAPIAEPAPNENSPLQPATEVQDPVGPEEETLARIFCEVIGIDRIGREESFFDVGGHSLLATKIIARVAKAFDVDLPLRAIFEAPTVAELAPHIQKSRQQRVRTQPTLKRHDGDSEKEKLLARLDHLSDAELQELLRNPNLENML